MFERHVSCLLSAYCHGEISTQDAERVQQHLRECDRCRRELDQVRLGVSLARQLPLMAAPAGLWEQVHRRLDEAPPPERTARSFWLRPVPLAAAAVLSFAVLSIFWYYRWREPLHLTVASTPLSTLESAALDQHRALLSGDQSLDYFARDPLDLRQWVERNTRLHASLALARPPEEAAQYRPVGARRILVGGVEVAVLAYRVDEHHVTLLTARLQDLADAPHAGVFSKDIAFRPISPGDLKMLTWGTAGQAYVMVSDLPGFGQRSCFICHTDQQRRELIRRAQPRPAGTHWWDYGVRQ
ncbi:MAG TPA: zf-HC2 domain-containing protein [Terriglobales bacterium]|nr:zf-HC2 domain-containing protein [Terriglobales bacterium]